MMKEFKPRRKKERRAKKERTNETKDRKAGVKTKVK
jgi:hypothetical protein